MMKIEFDKEDFEKRLNEALWGVALDIENSLKDKLSPKHGVGVTGLGKAGIKAYVVGSDIVVDIPEHMKYVEWGSPPHFPWDSSEKDIPQGLKDWTKKKWGSEKSAWALAVHISRQGTQPFPFIRPTIDKELVPFLRENLKEYFS